VPFAAAQAPTLTVEQPEDGATFENGAIPVEGTSTNAIRIAVSATYQGAAPGEAPRTSGTSTPAPEPEMLAVAHDGRFTGGLDLTTGRWAITVTASSAQSKSTTITRNVTVKYKGVNLVVEISGGPAWIKVWVDGQVEPGIGAAGRTFTSGKMLTFAGRESIEVRTGSSGVTAFTLNGTNLGTLGKVDGAETWLFRPPDNPIRTDRR
jgi:hypothetical protein